MEPASFRASRGATLIELLVVVVVMGAMAGIAVPHVRATLDRASARAAIQEAAALFSFARRSAITRRAPVAVIIDTVGGAVIVRVDGLELGRRSLGDRYGVRLSGTRDSISYDPRGLGYGAANLAVMARRGRGAETLFVSRLGRIRR